ncbi:MAG: transcription initiation protein [Candidatus Solibacter usitatus]|nr:transcription initiation protein [Candidatus Solibacter usitatus]
MANYLLLLHESATLAENIGRTLSAEEIQAMILKYKNWAGGLAAQNRLLGGHKLRDNSGRVMKGTSVTDGPYVESKEVIGGYFLIEAGSYDEAVALSRSCPHLEYGTIEVREVEPT